MSRKKDALMMMYRDAIDIVVALILLALGAGILIGAHMVV